jgi:hypothetical protein
MIATPKTKLTTTLTGIFLNVDVEEATLLATGLAYFITYANRDNPKLEVALELRKDILSILKGHHEATA